MGRSPLCNDVSAVRPSMVKRGIVVIHVRGCGVPFLARLSAASTIHTIRNDNAVRNRNNSNLFGARFRVGTHRNGYRKSKTKRAATQVRINNGNRNAANVGRFTSANVKFLRDGDNRQGGNHRGSLINRNTSIHVQNVRRVINESNEGLDDRSNAPWQCGLINVRFRNGSRFLNYRRGTVKLFSKRGTLLARSVTRLYRVVVGRCKRRFISGMICVFVYPPIMFYERDVYTRGDKSGICAFILIVVGTARRPRLRRLNFLIRAMTTLSLCNDRSRDARLLRGTLHLTTRLSRVTYANDLRHARSTSSAFRSKRMALSPRAPKRLLNALTAGRGVYIQIRGTKRRTLTANVMVPMTLVVTIALLTATKPSMNGSTINRFRHNVISSTGFLRLSTTANKGTSKNSSANIRCGGIFYRGTSPLAPPP